MRAAIEIDFFNQMKDKQMTEQEIINHFGIKLRAPNDFLLCLEYSNLIEKNSNSKY